jgi:hypothetical protein
MTTQCDPKLLHTDMQTMSICEVINLFLQVVLAM